MTLTSSLPSDWRRQLVLIAIVAAVLRGIVLTTMCWKVDQWQNLPYRSDGSLYIANARRINGEGITDKEYDRRGFVGFPWVIAMAQRVTTDYGATAQTLGVLFSCAMCVLAAATLRDLRIGWAMAVLPPHFILDTAAVLNESLMLSLCLLGLWLCQRAQWKHVLAAAVVFAAAAVVRPMACFAVAGAAALLWQAGKPRQSAAVLAGSLVAFAALIGLFAVVYWNPMENVAVYKNDPGAYGGQLLTYPFGSFVQFIQDPKRGIRFSLIYKAFYMLAAIGIAVVGVRAWQRSRTPIDAAMAAWWIGNLVFASCVGSHWGVDIAQRSLAWAAPAGFWILRDWLPTTWYWRLAWALLAPPLVFITSQG